MSDSDVHVDVAPVFTGDKKSFAIHRWLETQVLAVPIHSGYPRKVIVLQFTVQLLTVIAGFVLSSFSTPSIVLVEGFIYASILLAFKFLALLTNLNTSSWRSIRTVGDNVVLALTGFMGYSILHPSQCPLLLRIIGWVGTQQLAQGPLLGLEQSGDMSTWVAPGQSKLSSFLSLDSSIKGFHVIVLGMVHVLTGANHALVVQTVFCVLPLFWAMGMLPSIEPGLEWFFEQTNFIIFGHSTGSVSVSRGVVTFILSTILLVSLSALHYSSLSWAKSEEYPQHTAICVGIGMLLAQGYHWKLIKRGAVHANLVDPNAKFQSSIRSKSKVTTPKRKRDSILKRICDSRLLRIFVIVLACGIILPLLNLTATDTWNIVRWVGVACIMLTLLIVTSIRTAESVKLVLTQVTTVVTIFVLVMSNKVVYETSVASSSAYSPNFWISLWHTASLIRVGNATALRWKWSVLALAVSFLATSTATLTTTSIRFPSPVGIRAMLIELLFNRLLDLMQKLQYVYVHIASAYNTPKLRVFNKGSNFYHVVLPFLAGFSALVAAVLRAPLVPLFGTPLFIPGFPRPLRTCYSPSDDGYQHGKDSPYYEHLFQQLVPHLRANIPNPDVSPLCMIRFERMVVVVHVLERTASRWYARVTGLELQDTTSCHHVEAGAIDEAIQNKVGVWESKSRATFAPVSRLEGILAYSISKVQLTGVVETREFLRAVDTALWFTLTKFLSSEYCETYDCSWPLRDRNLDVEKVKMAATAFHDGALEGAEGHIGPAGSEMDDEDDIDALLASLGGEDIGQDACEVLNTVPKVNLPSIPDSPQQSKTSAFEERIDIIDHVGAEFADNDDWGLGFGLETRDRNQSSDPQSKKVHGYDDNTFPSAMQAAERQPETSTIDPLTRLIATAHALINREGLDAGGIESAGPSHVLDCFHGDFPPSIHSDWFNSGSSARNRKQILIKAFRFAFKLALDSILLGEPSLDDPRAVAAAIQELQIEWFIGSRSDPGWDDAVRRQVPHLAALSRDSDSGQYVLYQSSLSRQNGTIIALNPEAVRSIWAGQQLELIYFTNDDDERYSIQAHKGMLRNLIIQAAEPPLGYGVYGSPIIRI